MYTVRLLPASIKEKGSWKSDHIEPGHRMTLPPAKHRQMIHLKWSHWESGGWLAVPHSCPW